MSGRARLALPLVLSLLIWPRPAGAAEAHFHGSWVWPDRGVGGLSGLEVADDGLAFVAVSDRGTRHDGRFRRTDGRITGLQRVTTTPLRRRDGAAVTGGAVDAEGLACVRPASGAACDVSFEVIHRIVFFAAPDAVARNRPDPEALGPLQHNSGLEALAVDASGRLLAIPERSGDLARPFPVLRLDGRRWSVAYRLRRDPPFLPVGADIGPDGALYLLERHFTGLAFRARVRRFTLGPDGVTGEETLLTTRPGRHDNLEALAVWADAPGSLRLTMVSDDNFHMLQRTEFVEYRVRPALAKAAGVQ